MTDKVQKIREEVARIQLYTQSEVLKQVLDYIDKVQEEPVSENILDVSRIDYRLQHKNIEDGIKYHAEEYSFNIESILYNQLTNEQQELWRKELERAVISGGYYGLELSKDKRYKENSVSKELEEACEQLAENARKHKAETSSPFFSQTDYKQGVMDGAQWQKATDLVNTAYHLEMRLPEHLDYNGTVVERKDFIEDFKKMMEE